MQKSYSPRSIVDSGLCIGCGTCVVDSLKSGGQASMSFDDYGQLKPDGPDTWYNKAAESFSRFCPFSPSASNEDDIAEEIFPGVTGYSSGEGRFIKNYVGFVLEDEFRSEGSSGGMVSWLCCMLLRSGLVDGIAHVVAENKPQTAGRFFKYRISRSETEVHEGAKSRYYPVELSGVLQEIIEKPGRYAVVGIPCMIKAVRLLCRTDEIWKERIGFTLGLFCGHMKSSRFVESIAWQMKLPVSRVDGIDFRHKIPDRPANWYNAMIRTTEGTIHNKDWWHLADGDWGAGFFMINACNYCDDVVAETADISFGDAWVQPYASDGKGTNVIVVRSGIMQDIVNAGIKDGRLKLHETDAELVERTQAAGLRMRREGLGYRLSFKHRGVKPMKRVSPGSVTLTDERKRIYRIRKHISKWSHAVFRVSRIIHLPLIYITWARITTAVYHSIAYHGGSIAEMKKRYAVMKPG